MRKTLMLLSLLSAPPLFAEDLPAAASAPQAEALPASETVGVKRPASVPYSEALSWLDAFDQHHALAPQASLKFRLRAEKDKTLPPDLTLKIVGADKVETLAVQEGITTIPRLPELAADLDAVLRANVTRGNFVWRPVVRTPGLADNVQRLGDLRLMCHVWWPMIKPELPWVLRAGVSAMGGLCDVKSFGIYFPAPRKIADITLQAGERKEKIEARRIGKDGMSYFPPIAGSEWPDDTRLIFSYAGS